VADIVDEEDVVDPTDSRQVSTKRGECADVLDGELVRTESMLMICRRSILRLVVVVLCFLLYTSIDLHHVKQLLVYFADWLCMKLVYAMNETWVPSCLFFLETSVRGLISILS
jgi:hypothetical protein